MKVKTILFAVAMATAVATGAHAQTAKVCTMAAQMVGAIAGARDRGVSHEAADAKARELATGKQLGAMLLLIANVYDHPQWTKAALVEGEFDACQSGAQR